MIHFSDIQDALARNGRSDLQDAFRAFVGFPGEAKIESTVMLSDFLTTFGAVAEALQDDASIMPSGTVEILAEVGEQWDSPLKATTYAAGAEMVLQHMGTFAKRIRQHFDEEFLDG